MQGLAEKPTTTSPAPWEATVDATAARAALATVVPRLTALIRSIRNPTAPAVGVWNAGDVAVHLAHAWEILPQLAGGAAASPLREEAELAVLTTSMVRADAGRDLDAIAARIEAAATAFLATPPDSDPRPWMFEGTEMPGSAFACHLLNESLVHGFDIARADGRRWLIEPAHSGMAITGFLLPALTRIDPRFPVDQRRAAGLRTRVDVRVRGVSRFSLVICDGALRIEPPTAEPVDWHISGDPTTVFLVLWSRISPWAGLLTGRLVGWGRRPMVAVRLPGILRTP